MRTSIEARWIPVRTASKMLGVSRQRVYELMKNGQLGWCKMDLTVLVAAKSVQMRLLVKGKGDAS